MLGAKSFRKRKKGRVVLGSKGSRAQQELQAL